MKFIQKILLFTVLTALCTGSILADSEAVEWVDFYGNVTINGAAAPVGTVVGAYDPDNVLCGSFIVDSTGKYGFMHVYNDDNTTAGIDEGCLPGDSVRLTINGIDATTNVISGGLTWTANGDQKNVDISITGQTIAFTVVDFPQDTLAAPGWTVKFAVGIRNDGNGTDYYSVTSFDDTSASPGWTTTDQDSVSHASVGATTYVYFDVDIPLFGGGGDTAFVIHYTVASAIDTSVNYSDSVMILKSVTDVNDGFAEIPNRFNLAQNYPNPFNPTTNIAFTLPNKSTVRLEIINMLGQMVDVRNLGDLPAGSHAIEFDASSLSSGVYFYRLKTDNNSISRKMVLLK